MRQRAAAPAMVVEAAAMTAAVPAAVTHPELDREGSLRVVVCTVSCVSVADVWRLLSAAQKSPQKGHLAEKGLVHSGAAHMRCCGTTYEAFARHSPRPEPSF
jgi:hypothetical protein